MRHRRLAGAKATIVITASMAGLVASPGSGAYAASKSAAVALAKALRSELEATASNIRVVLLAPGMVKTNLMRSSAAQQPPGAMSDGVVQAAHAALNEFGIEPAEVALAVLDAMKEDRFWVLPPSGDRFSAILDDELRELNSAIQ